MFLSDKQIKDYQDDGVIIVKDIFKDWIEPIISSALSSFETTIAISL